ncbi:MAG: hypothetical protein K2Q34_08675 [Alphaproteobacteria bacterium]|nr:hypothetical protein [Alphaproteobacteria bacterium]
MKNLKFLLCLGYFIFCFSLETIAAETESEFGRMKIAAHKQILNEFSPLTASEKTYPDALKYQIAHQRLSLNVFGLLAKGQEEKALPHIALLAESGDLTWMIYYSCILFEGKPYLLKDEEQAKFFYREIKEDPLVKAERESLTPFMEDGLRFLEEHITE